jgi:hypothetical protein
MYVRETFPTISVSVVSPGLSFAVAGQAAGGGLASAGGRTPESTTVGDGVLDDVVVGAGLEGVPASIAAAGVAAADPSPQARSATEKTAQMAARPIALPWPSN